MANVRLQRAENAILQTAQSDPLLSNQSAGFPLGNQSGEGGAGATRAEPSV